MEQNQFSRFQRDYEATVEKVYNYVYYRTGRNRDLAEDLTSEVYLKALERHESYDPGGSFSSWIFTIARNHLIDRYRTQKETVAIDLLANVLPSPLRDLAGEIDDRGRVESILQGLDRLPDHQREILVLKFVNELDNTEIGRVLEKNPGAVRVALHRALRALKSVLADVPIS
jgi:RNA polymerase sigma-70 factor (ECF subfamily)